MSKNLRIRTKPLTTNVSGRRVGRICLALLEKNVLVDDVSVENALCSLEAHIVDPGVDLDELITEIGSVPHLLEVVLSGAFMRWSRGRGLMKGTNVGVNEYPFRVLHDTILQSFPTTYDAFESSLAARLLNHLSVSLLFIPLGTVTARVKFASLGQHRHAIELAAPVLQSLSGAIFNEVAIPDDDSASPSSPSSPTKRKSQQKRKQSMRASRAPVIDPRPFDNYGIMVPTSSSQASQLGATILEEQMNILKVCT